MANPKTTPQRKPRLGRGLSSLITNSSTSQDADRTYVPVSETARDALHGSGTEGEMTLAIPIDQIAPNPYQPRRDFKDEQLTELAESIARQGLLQALIVSPSPTGGQAPYTLIAGERRLRAARQAGLRRIPCTVRAATPEEMLEWALVENIQRRDLNPIERARGYREYLDRFNITQGELAQRIHQPRTTVTNHLRLLDLCDEVQRMIADGQLSFGHGKVLAALTGRPGKQGQLARSVLARDLSVRQLEEILTAPDASRPQVPHASKPPRPKAAYLVDIEQRLSERVTTRVTIVPGRTKNTGRLTIEYYSLDDFERITKMLGLEGEG